MTSPRWVLHPTLIAAAFVLEVALANKVEPAGFARALVIAILVGIGLTLVGWAVTRDRWIGGLIASILVVLSISIVPSYFAWTWLRSTFGLAGALAAFGIAAFAAASLPTLQLARARRGAALIRGPVTSSLNRFAAVLVLVVLIFHVAPDLPGAAADTLRGRWAVSVAPAADLPDIYVILLDGYPRADVLKRRFGIDNSPFLNELRELGFDVATDNHSNYVFTQLTLASIFQMRHLADVPALAPLIGQSGGHVNALRNALVDSPALATLRAGGYEIVVTQPGYEHVAMRNAADRVLERGEMNDLERDILTRTWLLDPLGGLMPMFFTGPTRDRVVHAFDDLGRLASATRTRPIFAWVHVPAPHLPLVMDAHGQPLGLDPRRFNGSNAAEFGMTDGQFASAYADELAYVNSRVVASAKALELAPRSVRPVIVIMSDHGFTYDLADVQARLSNLFATLTPHEPGLLAEAATPVNLMPLLLNRYLGTDYPLSSDRYFLSPSIFQLLELTEVPDPN